MIATATAKPMPGIAPNTATPAKQTSDSQNSHGWMRKIRARSVNSKRPIAEAITTAASAEDGRFCSRLGAATNNRPTAIAPTTPVNCVRAPAASATGVRDELLLIGKPWKAPTGQFSVPDPTLCLLGSYLRAGPRRKAAGDHPCAGKRQGAPRKTADNDGNNVVVTNLGDSESG